MPAPHDIPRQQQLNHAAPEAGTHHRPAPPPHLQLGQAGGPDRSWNSRFSRMHRLQTAGG